MGRVLEMIWTDIVTTWVSLRQWFDGVADDGAIWLVLLGAVLMLALLMFLLPGGRRRQGAEAKPQLLVSRGEIRSVEESNLTELSMHVSNLGDGVVQLLEAALSSDLMPTPETVELSVLVPRSRSVDVRVEVEELHGDSGLVDLYFYTPQTRKRAFRLRAELTWEPWNGRFKIEPLGQRIDSAKRLASTRLQKRQRDEWRRRQRELAQEAAAPVEPEPEPEAAMAEEPVAPRERLEFPSDF
jgi:hypothetical protein